MTWDVIWYPTIPIGLLLFHSSTALSDRHQNTIDFHMRRSDLDVIKTPISHQHQHFLNHNHCDNLRYKEEHIEGDESSFQEHLLQSPKEDKACLMYLNNPHEKAPVYVNCSAPDNERDEQILKAIQFICPHLFCRHINHNKKNSNGHDNNDDKKEKPLVLRSEDITIKKLGGGLSNYLFTVSSNYPSTSQSSSVAASNVLIRIHVGQEDDRFVNRQVENKIMAWLSSIHKSPKYYGRFLNGRIEEFYDSYVPLSCHDMKLPKFATPIAQQMAQFHLQTAPKGTCLTELHDLAHIWTRVDGWFDLAIQLIHDPPSSSSITTNVSQLKLLEQLQIESKMYQEWLWLKKELSTSKSTNDDDNDDRNSKEYFQRIAQNFARQNVFTHMDAQSLNILHPSLSNSGKESKLPITEQDLRLIDFEYAGHNSRAMDIANTFCEHCDMNNLCPKYPLEYPSKQQQLLFLNAYLEVISKDDLKLRELKSTSSDKDWDVFVETFRKTVNQYSLVSHLGWSIWGVAQAFLSPIEFDYLEYAHIRMEGYDWAKEKFF